MIKKYDSYSEEYKLNENILTNAWNKLNSYFKSKFGKNAWLYYSKYLKDKGEIPTYVDEDGKTRDVVEIIIPDNHHHIARTYFLLPEEDPVADPLIIPVSLFI